jgi:hypothetical protein
MDQSLKLLSKWKEKDDCQGVRSVLRDLGSLSLGPRFGFKLRTPSHALGIR